MQLPFTVKTTYGTLPVFGVLKHKLCYFGNDSGSGKTFLFNILESYCDANNISVAVIDYRRRNDSVESILASCSDKELVLLDNVELYPVSKVIEKLLPSNTVILVSHHEVLPIQSSGYKYKVMFTETQLEFYALGQKGCIYS